MYPVGSLYLSMDVTSPAEIFGGEWSRVANGRCLVGVDETDTDFKTVATTGGAKTHKHSYRLAVAEFWSTVGFNGGGSLDNVSGAMWFDDNKNDWVLGDNPHGNGHPWVRYAANVLHNINSGAETGSNVQSCDGYWTTGETNRMSSTQPFITCYIWQRIA